MNYFAGILGIALMGAIATAAIFRGNAAEWHQKYDDRVNQEQTALNIAKANAQIQETKALQALDKQSSQAISQALQGQKTAQQQLKDYQAKLAAAASAKGDGYRCAGVEIPKDLIP